jgi:hypothetical protein
MMIPDPFLTLSGRDFSEKELDEEFANNGSQRTPIIYAMLKEILKKVRTETHL